MFGDLFSLMRSSHPARPLRRVAALGRAALLAAALAAAVGCPGKGTQIAQPTTPDRPRLGDLPPALPHGLTPAEARAQTADVQPVAASLVGRETARIAPGKAPIGYARFVVDAPAKGPVPAMRLVAPDGQGKALGPFGPAAQFSTKDPATTRWEFFAVLDPNDERACEFFYP